jgi:hypothetical protein
MRYSEYITLNSVTVKIRGDNQKALILIKNPHLYKYLKHINVTHHYICNLQEKNCICTNYIPTDKIITDELTKLLVKPGFKKFIQIVKLQDKKEKK